MNNEIQEVFRSTFDLNNLITPVITIISIFISNYLGRKSEIKKFKFDSSVETYKKYHLGLIKLLLNINPSSRTYFLSIALNKALIVNGKSPLKNYDNWLQTHIGNNLEYAPESVVKIYREYCSKSSTSELFFHLDENGEYIQKYYSHLEAASNLFDQIIIDSLTEAVRLSKLIGYPNIAQHILEDFLYNVSSSSDSHRILPEQYQQGLPRVFVGPKPPYY